LFARLTHFVILHHVAEGNIYYEATGFLLVTFIVRQCGW
jgi:hypothetical protein